LKKRRLYPPPEEEAISLSLPPFNLLSSITSNPGGLRETLLQPLCPPTGGYERLIALWANYKSPSTSKKRRLYPPPEEEAISLSLPPFNLLSSITSNPGGLRETLL